MEGGHTISDQLQKAKARLQALRQHLPEHRVSERYVDEYHEVLRSLEDSGRDINDFRIDEQHVSARLACWNDLTGERRYTPQKYVDTAFMLSKLDAVLGYLDLSLESARTSADSSRGGRRSLADLSLGQKQTIRVYGGTVNIAQSAGGEVIQAISPLSDELAKLQPLLRELEHALRVAEIPVEERAGFLEPVEQIAGELQQPRPLRSRLLAGWGAVQALAAAEGAWQGWDRVQRIALEVGPRILAVLNALGSSPS